MLYEVITLQGGPIASRKAEGGQMSEPGVSASVGGIEFTPENGTIGAKTGAIQHQPQNRTTELMFRQNSYNFV